MQTVAVLDDHPAVLVGMKVLIRRLPGVQPGGFHESVVSLLAGLNEKPHDAVVIDYQLAPGEPCCAELISRILQTYPLMKVVVLSAHRRPSMVRQCLDAGAFTVLSKREPLEKLMAQLRVAISS